MNSLFLLNKNCNLICDLCTKTIAQYKFTVGHFMCFVTYLLSNQHPLACSVTVTSLSFVLRRGLQLLFVLLCSFLTKM